jgi:hypothetical protein
MKRIGATSASAYGSLGEWDNLIEFALAATFVCTACGAILPELAAELGHGISRCASAIVMVASIASGS